MSRSSSSFESYVEAARGAVEDLRFLLDHVDVEIEVDFSEKSLESVEHLYHDIVRGRCELPGALGTPQDFIELACRYAGQAIIHHTNGRWIKSPDRNRRGGLPCVDFQGCPSWGRFHASHLAASFSELSKTNPQYRGLDQHRVLAEALREALRNAQKVTNLQGGTTTPLQPTATVGRSAPSGRRG